MFTVFVLGNIASGKSTACRYFESRGAMLIDLDELAKSLYVPGSDIVNALVDEFGWDILDEDGGIRRSILASRAFASPDLAWLMKFWSSAPLYQFVASALFNVVWSHLISMPVLLASPMSLNCAISLQR